MTTQNAKWKLKMSFTGSWKRRAPSRWNLSVKRFFQTALKCRLPLMRKWRNTICPTRQSSPKTSRRSKKFQSQRLTTDTGIEITIPMEEYQNPDRVEFITNPDGTISVLIQKHRSSDVKVGKTPDGSFFLLNPLNAEREAKGFIPAVLCRSEAFRLSFYLPVMFHLL